MCAAMQTGKLEKPHGVFTFVAWRAGQLDIGRKRTSNSRRWLGLGPRLSAPLTALGGTAVAEDRDRLALFAEEAHRLPVHVTRAPEVELEHGARCVVGSVLNHVDDSEAGAVGYDFDFTEGIVYQSRLQVSVWSVSELAAGQRMVSLDGKYAQWWQIRW